MPRPGRMSTPRICGTLEFAVWLWVSVTALRPPTVTAASAAWNAEAGADDLGPEQAASQTPQAITKQARRGGISETAYHAGQILSSDTECGGNSSAKRGPKPAWSRAETPTAPGFSKVFRAPGEGPSIV